MKTLNNVVLFVLLVALSVVAFACADSDSPTAPSATTSTMAEAPSSVPVNAVRTTPASFDADRLQPGTGDDNDGFNAYDFDASYDGSMLTLALIEDQMTAMREASKPHRNRRITVGICPSEPHHRLQACGDPIWQGSMRLAGRLELDPIPLASCNGWIVVNAAELSDDRYDGWRNAPCPATDGEPVGSDGSGDGWPDYPEPEPQPEPTAPVLIADTGCVRVRWLSTASRNLDDWEFPYELVNTCSYSVDVHFQEISGLGVYSSITGMVNWGARPFIDTARILLESGEVYSTSLLIFSPLDPTKTLPVPEVRYCAVRRLNVEYDPGACEPLAPTDTGIGIERRPTGIAIP